MTAPARFDLAGRVALVTGASSGIGREIARGLAEAGAAVVLVARRAQELERACREVEAEGGRAARIDADLADRHAVRYVADKYGVNHLGCICALDRATLPTLLQYWVPEVDVTGISELVGNALVFEDEIERTTDLRDRDLVGFGEAEEAEEEE